jgi:GNAT superfamily N-acetyltransferase
MAAAPGHVNESKGMIAATTADVSDGVALRTMTATDLSAAHALTVELRWPHRRVDWEQVFRHAEGLVAVRDRQIIGTGLRWRWGPKHATIGLVVVAAACQGRRIGHRLMTALLGRTGGLQRALARHQRGALASMSASASCARARSASIRAPPNRRRWSP